jgi:UDP-glucuronate decarboxylase
MIGSGLILCSMFEFIFKYNFTQNIYTNTRMSEYSLEKTILITGSAGFIGTNLVYRLLEDPMNKIIGVDNLLTSPPPSIQHERYHFIPCDIVTDLDDVKKSFPKIDEIYHLASIASPPKYKKYPIQTLDVNVIGTRAVLQLAVEHKARFILTSTSEVYGDPLEHPQCETYYGNVNIVGERSCYDESKRCAETYVYEYAKMHNTTDFKICRIFNTYGPHMDINDGRVITNIIRCIRDGTPVTIHGNGCQTRSFCYISDMLDGLMALMASDEKGPMNLGNPYTEYNIEELVLIFEHIIGYKLRKEYVYKTENDPMVRRPDISLAEKTIGFHPRVTMENGLLSTIMHLLP